MVTGLLIRFSSEGYVNEDCGFKVVCNHSYILALSDYLQIQGYILGTL